MTMNLFTWVNHQLVIAKAMEHTIYSIIKTLPHLHVQISIHFLEEMTKTPTQKNPQNVNID
jgi:hypothetical protein